MRRGVHFSALKAEIASMQQEQQARGPGPCPTMVLPRLFSLLPQALEARLKELRKQREDLAHQLKACCEIPACIILHLGI